VLQPAAAAAQHFAPAPAPHPMACGICMENVPALVPVGIEVERGHYFNKRCCAHSFCAGCLRQHVDTAISNGLQVIRCPEANCNYALYPDDIARLGDPAAVAQLAQLRNFFISPQKQEKQQQKEKERKNPTNKIANLLLFFSFFFNDQLTLSRKSGLWGSASGD
jgi:hypothetical protein